MNVGIYAIHILIRTSKTTINSCSGDDCLHYTHNKTLKPPTLHYTEFSASCQKRINQSSYKITHLAVDLFQQEYIQLVCIGQKRSYMSYMSLCLPAEVILIVKKVIMVKKHQHLLWLIKNIGAL